MTLRMADGPPSNLPQGMDAYAGYVNMSGIGITFPQIRLLATAQHAIAFSFTTNGSPAMCADVEKGAMQDWTGYDYGYCSVARVNELVSTYGRPRKLLTAHYDPKYGAHICGPETCNYGADLGEPLITSADGTQWTNHGGAWDESLLSDNFFDPPTKEENETMTSLVIGGQLHVFGVIGSTAWHWWQEIGPPASTWHSEQLPS